MSQEIPKQLVITWYELLTKSESEEARQRAVEMLLGTFGDMKSVAEYLKKEGIC